MKQVVLYAFTLFFAVNQSIAQTTKDPLKVQLVTSDIDNFWKAYDHSAGEVKATDLEKIYLKNASKGLKGFIKRRIQSGEYLSQKIKRYQAYYAGARTSTNRIAEMKPQIIESLVKLKEIYPEAIFPPVYFVVGALNSGGTTGKNSVIIGSEMYALTADTDKNELSNWLKTVLKPVDQVPHIVAHEVVHVQQNYRLNNLLSRCIMEGSADFIAALISGKHINQHVHDFANPKEQELWLEFKALMYGKEYDGWLYSSSEGRPNDLGYWIGYKITKSYYDHATNKSQAINDILNIKDFSQFLEDSQYMKGR